MVSLSILLTLCAMLAQTLVYVEREEEAKRREEAKEDYERAKEAIDDDSFLHRRRCRAKMVEMN